VRRERAHGAGLFAAISSGAIKVGRSARKSDDGAGSVEPGARGPEDARGKRAEAPRRLVQVKVELARAGPTAARPGGRPPPPDRRRRRGAWRDRRLILCDPDLEVAALRRRCEQAFGARIEALATDDGYEVWAERGWQCASEVVVRDLLLSSVAAEGGTDETGPTALRLQAIAWAPPPPFEAEAEAEAQADATRAIDKIDEMLRSGAVEAADEAKAQAERETGAASQAGAAAAAETEAGPAPLPPLADPTLA
jgi:hypothetical protein